MMNKKPPVFFILCLMFTASIVVYAEDNIIKTGNFSTGELLSEIRGNIILIEKDINYLVTKHVKVEKISTRLKAIKLHFNLMIKNKNSKELKSKVGILNLELNNLLSESESKVASFKRFNILSLMMLIFGFLTVSLFIIFYVIFFSRERKE